MNAIRYNNTTTAGGNIKYYLELVERHMSRPTILISLRISIVNSDIFFLEVFLHIPKIMDNFHRFFYIAPENPTKVVWARPTS